MKYDIMSLSHREAKALRYFGDKRSYKELLSVSLKVRHMMKRTITVIDINWLMSNYPTRNIDISEHVKSLHISKRFELSGSIKNDIDLEISRYVRPRTESEDNHMIGVMIESEIKSGHRVNID